MEKLRRMPRTSLRLRRRLGSIGARASAVVTGLECGRTAASRTPGLRVPRCQPINNIARAFIKRCDVKASCVRPLCVCCIEAPRCKPS
eukprot:305917-Pyramimonas_sp.AAC.1